MGTGSPRPWRLRQPFWTSVGGSSRDTSSGSTTCWERGASARCGAVTQRTSPETRGLPKSVPPYFKSRVDVERQGSFPFLALPSVVRRQALAGRILPLLFETAIFLVFHERCMQSISGGWKIEYFLNNPYFTDKNCTFYYKKL